MSKERGSRNGLPAFVAIPEKDLSAEAGFLGSAHDPFVTGDPNAKGFSVKDLTLPAGVSDEEELIILILSTILMRGKEREKRFKEDRCAPSDNGPPRARHRGLR